MNIFRHKPEAYLFFILVISAQVVTSEKAFTCQTDMDCPVNIAPTCDNFNYCECNVNTACSPSSVMLLPNTINNVTIAGNSFNNYYKIYQTVLTSVEITYSFTDVTGNNDKFNVFFLAYIGSSYLLISQFLGQLFGANPTNFTLPMLSLGRLPDNTDQYIVILLENVGGNTVMLTIQSS